MIVCLTQPLVEIVRELQNTLLAGVTPLELVALDPDFARGHYAGERVDLAGTSYTHRPFRVWVDLAERLGLRLLTPRAAEPPLVTLRFERLVETERLYATSADPTERYGTASPFARISKHEDPGFVLDLADALARAKLPRGARILDLGVNTGDELALVMALAPQVEPIFVGIDHSGSALATARARFGANVTLHVADVNALGALDLGRFDLVLSIGTLQSPGIDDRAVVRQLVQRHLTPDGSLILGFPNCRYVDGETAYGARMKNFRQPELGLLIKDIAFYRKYLQQHDRQVFVTGKHYVFVTGVRSKG